MKKTKIISVMTAILCFAMFIQTPGHTDAEEPRDNWKLTWSDEFDGNMLNPDVWSYETGNWILNEKGGYETSGWGNNEQEFYTDKNAVVSDGTLKIQVKKETYVDDVQGTYEYTSSKLVTKNKFSVCYGKINIRARVDSGKTLWPAIWMLPEDNVYGAWASSGEIDIMEGYGSMPQKICGTIHFGDLWPNNKYLTNEYLFKDNDSTENWHVYSVEWEDNQIRWYVDDVLYSSQSDWYSSGRTYPAPFDQNFYLILNLAVGGHFDGIDGIYADPTIFENGPKQMEVDYVRVYQRDGISHTPSTPAHSTLEPYFMDGGIGTMSNSDNGTQISITNAGTQTYSVMAALEGLEVGPQRQFSVDFDIWSSVPRDIEMTVENASYQRYYDKTISLNKEPTHCHYDFSFDDAQNVDLKIQAGNVAGAAALGNHTVYISNLKWTEAGKETVSQPVTVPVTEYTETQTSNVGTKPVSESSGETESTLYGDVNLDRKIDITDMTYISLYCLGDIKLSDKAFKNADVVTDGEVNLADLSTMKQYIMKENVVLGKK